MRCHACNKRGKENDFVLGKDGRYRCDICHEEAFKRGYYV